MSALFRRESEPRLGAMVTRGAGALRRYPGLAVTLYGVQVVIAAVAAWSMATVLAAAFAARPFFDRAVDGDVMAAASLLLKNAPLATAVFAAGVGAAMLYGVLSWFLTGGLIGTLIERPSGRRSVANCFGAAGASTFLVYVRLWLWCLIPYAAAAVAFVVGARAVHDDLRFALTLGDALARLLPTALPAVALAWLTALAAGYARVALSLERATPAWRALLAGYRLVLTRWRPAVHALLFGMVWVAITLLYLLVIDGRAMAGAGGAVLLCGIRQVTAMLRFAAKIAFVGGQVALATEWDDDSR